MPQAKLLMQLEGDEDKLQIIGIYQVSPPIDGNKFVVLSSVNLAHFLEKKSDFKSYILFPDFFSCETYIFASDGREITSFCELQGSQKGTMSHKEIFEDLGYEVENPLS